MISLAIIADLTRWPFSKCNQCQEHPPLSDSPIPMSQTSDKEKFRLLSEEVQSLLLKSVIEEIPPTQSTPGFYSRLFLVAKKTGGIGQIHTENKMEGTKTARGPPPSPTIAQNNKVKSVCFVTIGA